MAGSGAFRVFFAAKKAVDILVQYELLEQRACVALGFVGKISFFLGGILLRRVEIMLTDTLVRDSGSDFSFTPHISIHLIYL